MYSIYLFSICLMWKIISAKWASHTSCVTSLFSSVKMCSCRVGHTLFSCALKSQSRNGDNAEIEQKLNYDYAHKWVFFFGPCKAFPSFTLLQIEFYFTQLTNESMRKRESNQITTNLSKQKCIFHALEYEFDYETPIQCLCTMERREKSIKLFADTTSIQIS